MKIRHEFSMEMGNKSRVICPVCGRWIWLDEFEFISNHREDPPSTVTCSGSGISVA